MDRNFRLGKFIPILALDAVFNVYEYIGLTHYSSEALIAFKAAVQNSNFSTDGNEIYSAFMNLSLSKQTKEFLYIWLGDLFIGRYGQNAGDEIIEGWLDIFHALQYRDLHVENLSDEQLKSLSEIVAEFKKLETDDGYQEEVDHLKERFDLTDWDLKLHEIYRFNYFDDASGADPFLFTNETRKGTILLKIARTHEYFMQGDFPYVQIREAIEKLDAEDGVQPRPKYYQDIRLLKKLRPFQALPNKLH